MNHQGYGNIPSILFHWITFLAQSLPLRSVPTFIELLIGAMISKSGFVVQTGLAIDLKRHWTTYFKWLQKGRWSWLALARQRALLLVHWFPNNHCFLAIDDTVVFRTSTKAPGSRIHHQHANKANRPKFVRGQGWVSLAAVVGTDQNHHAIPLLARLSRSTTNTSKLVHAKTLLRAIRGIFQNVTLLMDSWFMRATLIGFALEDGYTVIGQVRKDTALYAPPHQPPIGKRGRPKIYGDKFTPENVAKLPEVTAPLWIYGKRQTVRYRSTFALARFLKARTVLVVWTCFEDEKGLTKPRLLLSTSTAINPETVITNYARRWSIEPMFNQIKNGWGWKETWQQSRQVLHRWLQILFTAFALPQLLTLLADPQVMQLANLAPWRSKQPITAGLVRLGLQTIFTKVRVRDWWNPKSRIFQPPKAPHSASSTEKLKKAA